MAGIRTNAAAVMLGVSPNTLRSWERRYGFPRPHRSPGGHRQYALPEIEALKHTLAETHNVSSAVSLARERGEGPSSAARLAAAYTSFDEPLADKLLEESLALRSIERTIEEVLLGAVEHHAERAATPEYQCAWRHASGWMSALKRLSPPATRTEGLLLFDATAPCEVDYLYAQALELIMRRAGLRTLSLTPAIEPGRLGRAVRALEPGAVVLTGRRASLDSIGRLLYAVRGAIDTVTVFDFRGAVPDTGASTVFRLAETPIAARETLLARFDEPRTASASGGPAPAVALRRA